MEKLNLYCVYDTKAEIYGTPFVARNSVIARRLFTQLLGDKNLPYCQAIPDYCLVHIGSYCDTTAHIDPITPQIVATGSQILLEYQQSRGAAVGGESPLKPQSASDSVTEEDAASPKPACDPSVTSSEAQTPEVSE